MQSWSKITLVSIILFSGIFSVYLFESLTLDAKSTSFLSGSSIAFMRGHTEIIASNENGVFSYQQSDNKIVTHGENCMAKMIFGASGGDELGGTVCVGIINAGWNFIGLGETGTASNMNDSYPTMFFT